MCTTGLELRRPESPSQALGLWRQHRQVPYGILLEAGGGDASSRALSPSLTLKCPPQTRLS